MIGEKHYVAGVPHHLVVAYRTLYTAPLHVTNGIIRARQFGKILF
jgi:hypothetical protein